MPRPENASYKYISGNKREVVHAHQEKEREKTSPQG